jgi:hypothetical protein
MYPGARFAEADIRKMLRPKRVGVSNIEIARRFKTSFSGSRSKNFFATADESALTMARQITIVVRS